VGLEPPEGAPAQPPAAVEPRRADRRAGGGPVLVDHQPGSVGEIDGGHVDHGRAYLLVIASRSSAARRAGSGWVLSSSGTGWLSRLSRNRARPSPSWPARCSSSRPNASASLSIPRLCERLSSSE